MKMETAWIASTLDSIQLYPRDRDNIPIAIFTGVNGNQRGANWIQKCETKDCPFKAEQVAMNRKLTNRSLFDMDKKAYKDKLTNKYKKLFNRINIVDLSNWSYTKFENMLKQGYVHIILAFNYSRNDMAYRYIFKLKSVDSLTVNKNTKECEFVNLRERFFWQVFQ